MRQAKGSGNCNYRGSLTGAGGAAYLFLARLFIFVNLIGFFSFPFLLLLLLEFKITMTMYKRRNNLNNNNNKN